MGEVTEDGTVILDQPHEIAMYSLLTMRSALGLQVKGLRVMRGTTALAVARHRGLTQARNARRAWEDVDLLVRLAGGPETHLVPEGCTVQPLSPPEET